MIQHTDCGTIRFRDDKIQSARLERAPNREEEIREMTFGQIKDVDRSIVDDVEWIRECTLLRKELRGAVVGMSFDIKTGELRKVI